MSRNESVDVLRKKIDQIDEKVVNLLNDRAVLAQRIGQTKSLSNQEVYVPQREQDILNRLAGQSRGPLPSSTIRSIYREIISGCRSMEAPLKVVFFGAEATYSHLAAKEKFGSSSELRPTASIPEVFQEVSQDRACFGVVPIENSTEGVVAHTLDCLVESELQICAEIFLEIHHNLLSLQRARRGHSADHFPSAGAGPVPRLAGEPFPAISPWRKSRARRMRRLAARRMAVSRRSRARWPRKFTA